MSETFVGLDPTSAFATKPRAVDIAILSGNGHVEFKQWHWPAPAEVTARSKAVVNSLLEALGRGSFDGVVLAIDGPCGLASEGRSARAAERALRTPGRTPDALPKTGGNQRPFAEYIASSLHLFAALLDHVPELRLAGLGATTLEEANLFEVYPGAEWAVLAGRKLPKKTSAAGRQAREQLWRAAGLTWSSEKGLLTHDENDALVGAFLARCTRLGPTVVSLVGEPPQRDGEWREGCILHASASIRATLSPSEPAPTPETRAATPSGGGGPEPVLGPALTTAFSYARELHSGQARKGSQTPYLSHLLAVAALVLEHGGDEDQAIAALLHDGPEDQGGEAVLTEIRQRFGDRVADIVMECSDTFDTPKPPWRQRKEDYLRHLGEVSAATYLVSAADKVHNLRCIVRDFRDLGVVLWERFRASRAEVIWYYAALVEAYEKHAPPNVQPLVGELRGLLRELWRLIDERS